MPHIAESHNKVIQMKRRPIRLPRAEQDQVAIFLVKYAAINPAKARQG